LNIESLPISSHMPVGLEAWITQIPPITRGWFALSVLMSLAVVCAPRLSKHPLVVELVCSAMSTGHATTTLLQLEEHICQWPSM